VGFQPKHFSFNVDGGRAMHVKVKGSKLSRCNSWQMFNLTCEVCGGKKFKERSARSNLQRQKLLRRLEMSVDDAIYFFSTVAIKRMWRMKWLRELQPFSDVGLGYVKLGQSVNTLSGGEANVLSLASFLGKGKSQGNILFIFDEPYHRSHFHDIKKLLASFNALIEQGIHTGD
jgi:excinuclease ABC subunit A